MSGIIPIDRRDLNRLLNGLVHAEKRDDVKVEVKYYVQFSFAGAGDDAMAVQTLVDPFSPPNRRAMRDLVGQAIKRLDEEEEKRELSSGPESIISNLKAATAIPAIGAPVDTTEPVREAQPTHHSMQAETGYYNLTQEVPQ